MKRLHYIFCFALIVTGTGALCDEIPVLYLEEGIHEVSLSVVNNRDAYLDDIRVSFDNEKVPDWLIIHDTDQTMDISGGERGAEKFILAFDVTSAPDGAFAEIPYTLKDSKGKVTNGGCGCGGYCSSPCRDTKELFPEEGCVFCNCGYDVKDNRYNVIYEGCHILPDMVNSGSF